MIHNRVRIVDVADALGLSTATVSKVIHGNTEKISDETVKRVQQELERTGCRIWWCDACGIMAGNIRYVSCEYRGSVVYRGGDYDLVCSHI